MLSAMIAVMKHWTLWLSAALLALLDGILCAQIITFIGYSANERSGSARMWVATKIGWIALASIPFALWTVRSHIAIRREMNPPALFVARFPLLCLAALLTTYYVVLPLL
jgi:hypothetical protein